MPARSNFPRNPADGAEVVDRNGTKFAYDAQTKSWKNTGTIIAPAIASDDNDGIVTPEIYEKLNRVKKFIDAGGQFNFIKLRPGTDAHYYYFRSSDKCVRFKAESDDIVRVELDRGRIYSIFANTTCVGPTGPQGDTGDKGRDGLILQSEFCYAPTTKTPTRLDFAAVVPLAYGKEDKDNLPNRHVPDISVRFYRIIPEIQCNDAALDGVVTRGPQQTGTAVTVVSTTDQVTTFDALFRKIKRQNTQFETFKVNRQLDQLGLSKQAVTCNIPLSIVIEIAEGKRVLEEPIIEILIDPLGDVPPRLNTNLNIDNDQSTFSYDYETGLLCCTLIAGPDTTFNDNYCVRALQRGLDGLKGCSGEKYVKIVKNYLDNTSIVAANPIINVRWDTHAKLLHFATVDITTQISSDYLLLGPAQASLNSNSVAKSSFAAVEMSLDDFKSLAVYKPNVVKKDFPDLELPHWTPQGGCRTSRNFANQTFNWESTLDPTCVQTISNYSPIGTKPVKLILPKAPPPDTYNQADFFYVPNIQSGVAKPTQSSGSTTNIVNGGNF